MEKGHGFDLEATVACASRVEFQVAGLALEEDSGLTQSRVVTPRTLMSSEPIKPGSRTTASRRPPRFLGQDAQVAHPVVAAV
ncbi:MAG: hypothetical protein FJ026_10785 [Chloroflexi bacterium]|nr:hypothetical protein [Chloroflexota bacterium]